MQLRRFRSCGFLGTPQGLIQGREMLCATLVAVKSNFCSFTLLTSLAKLMGSQWGTYGNCRTPEAMKAPYSEQFTNSLQRLVCLSLAIHTVRLTASSLIAERVFIAFYSLVLDRVDSRESHVVTLSPFAENVVTLSPFAENQVP
jgi:hypothetical protein